MSLLTHVLVPLVSLPLSLSTWRLAYKRGWNQLLPIFSRYLAFYCVSTVLLLALFYCNLYPGRMQATICLLYSYCYFSVQIVTAVFVLVVLYELLTHTSRNRADVQARVTAFLGVAALAAAFTLAGAGTAVSGAPSYCLRLAYFDSVFGKAVELIVLGLFAAMIVLKISYRLRWGRGISLIVLGLVQAFVVDFALSIVVYNGHLKSVSDVIAQISGFILWVIWWLAVRKAPDAFAAQPSAAAVPV